MADRADSSIERRAHPRVPAVRWSTSLTSTAPNKVLVRGFPLDEMMGRLSFAEAVYLLLMGELPSPAIGRMLNAVLISSIDHGVTPPSTLTARTVATSGAPLKDCVAAGILALGPHHGGDELDSRFRMPPRHWSATASETISRRPASDIAFIREIREPAGCFSWRSSSRLKENMCACCEPSSGRSSRSRRTTSGRFLLT